MEETFIGPNFQTSILRLMSEDFEFFLHARELIRPEYFTGIEYQWFFREIIRYREDYDSLPTFEILKHKFEKAVATGNIDIKHMPAYGQILKDFTIPIAGTKDYIRDETIKFCKAQATKGLFLKYGEKLNGADAATYLQMYTEMEKIVVLGNGLSDLGINYFLDFPDLIRRRIMEESLIKIPCGIPELDAKLNGGIRAGQIGVFMGGTNSGKSIVLPHCAKAAVFNNYNVAYYSTELTAEDVCTRFDAAFTGVNVNELITRQQEVQKILREVASKVGDRLKIKFYPTGEEGVDTIYAHLRSLQATGFEPQLVVIDMADLLRPPVEFKDTYQNLGGIFKALRGLAGKMKLPIWTATQTNRAGYKAETADLDVMGDSFQKAQISDVVISINSSQELYDNNIAQLFICKNRNGRKWEDVWIRTAYNRMCFYDPTGPAVPDILKERYRKNRRNENKKKNEHKD